MTVLSAIKLTARQLTYCLVLLFCLSAISNPLPKELHLVSGNDFKPWSDQSLPNGGVITEIVQTAFQYLGINTTVEWLPWKRGYHRVAFGGHGNYGTFPYSHSNKRAVDTYYSIPILISGLTIFVLDRNPIETNYKDHSALHGLRFCTGVGYAFGDFEKLVDNGSVSLKRLANINNCFLGIKAGRLDAVVLNKHVGWGIVHSLFKGEHGFRALREHSPSVYHLVVSKDYPNTLDILHGFNKSLVKLKENGVIDEIVNRHMKPNQ